MTLPKEQAYNANISNLENFLQKELPGEYSFYSASNDWVGGPLINFNYLENTKNNKVTVERELNNKIYLYRLSFDNNNQPVLKKIITN